MTVVFGTYSLKIRSYTTEELGLDPIAGESPPLEVRQKVFHIFWIPVFPIGRVYGRRLEDGKLYTIPNSYEQAIEAHGTHRMPWYSFALPILLLLCLLISTARGQYRKYESHRLAKSSYESAISDISTGLTQLAPRHYIELMDADQEYSDKTVFLKVLAVTGSRIVCARIVANVSTGQAGAHEVEQYFNVPSVPPDTVVLDRGMMQAAYMKDYDAYRKKKVGQPLLHDKHNFLIHGLYYLDGPSLVLGAYTEGRGLSVDLENTGAAAQLIAVSNTRDSVAWDIDLPADIGSGEEGERKFSLRAPAYRDHGDVATMLVFQDPAGENYKFLLQREDGEWTVERSYE